MFLGIIFIILFTVWFYVMWGRDWLFERLKDTRYHYYYDKINELWFHSRTVLVGRMYWVIGVLITLHETAGAMGLDFTPLYSEIGSFIPEKYRSLVLAVFFYATGLLIVKLRRMTAVAYEEKREGEG